MKIAFGTVVYQQAEKYLSDFWASLNNQTYPVFDIICVNDDMDQQVLDASLKIIRQKKEVIRYNENYPPHILRIELMKTAKEKGYDLLILGDCDDTFSSDRVDYIANQFEEEYAFFYNEILTFYKKKVMPPLPEDTAALESILQFNYLGLSNTALNLHHISLDFLETLRNKSTSIFDWILYSMLLINHKKGKKIKGGYTYYRIHENNVAGMPLPSEANIENERQVKINHYHLLKDYHEVYKRLLSSYEKGDIIKKCKKTGEYYYWWEMTEAKW